MTVDVARPDREKTRTELTLSRILRAWVRVPQGDAYGRALVEYLRSIQNRETLRAYAYGILEFFEYAEARTRRFPLPSEVSRADAAQYASWLLERTVGLEHERLRHDPERQLDLHIYEAVARQPDATADEIRSALLAVPALQTVATQGGRTARVLRVDLEPGGLAKRLGCLVDRKTLTRAPTIEEIRSGKVRIPDWTPAMQSQVGFTYEVPPGIFRYRTPTQAGDLGRRASTVALRLSALSAYWRRLTVADVGRAPLLTVDVWHDPLTRLRGQSKNQQRATRAERAPDPRLYARLLATTYYRSHGEEQALAAAEQAMRGIAVTATARALASLADLRDRTVLLVMLQAGGPRANELSRLRRLDYENGLLTIRGKGDKVRRVRVPPAAQEAIRELDTKIRRLVEHGERHRGVASIASLLDPTAPLLPPVGRWGSHAHRRREEPLTRQGFAMMLRRRAARAGISEQDLVRIHPHAMRRLFARMSLGAGTPLNEVQAMIGHESGSTTLQYAEVYAEDAVARAFEAPPAATVPAPPPPPAPSTRPTVTTLPAPAREVIRRPLPKPPVVRSKAPPAPPPTAPEAVSAPAMTKVTEVAPESPGPLIGHGELPVQDDYQGLEHDMATRVGRRLTREDYAVLAACAERPGVLARLCAIYGLDWGERGSRRRIGKAEELRTAGAVRAVEALEAAFSGAAGTTPRELSEAILGRLGHTYIGTESGLVWWDGPAGKFATSMPVPLSALDEPCGDGDEGDLCAGIAALWRRWMAGEPGPTAAAALVAWTRHLLEQGIAVQAALGALEYEVVSADAPWADTDRATQVARDHAPSAVLEWLECAGREYRVSRGRHGTGTMGRAARAQKPVDERVPTPAWYGDPDPIASLPADERAEALDLLRVLLGDYGLTDRAARYQGRSRAELARLLVALQDYDAARADWGEARQLVKTSPSEEAERAARLAEKETRRRQAAVEATLRSLGSPVDFAERVLARVRAQRGGARSRRAGWYLDLIGDLYGPEAARDPLLEMVARGGPGALAPYRELLQPDERAGTIRHARTYIEEYARATSTHSECVARRIARTLYDLHRAYRRIARDVADLARTTGTDPTLVEMWMRGVRRSGSRTLDTADERALDAAARQLGVTRGRPADVEAYDRRQDLLDLVEAMTAYRIPCPATQESEIRRAIGATDPLPVYEAWRAAIETAEEEEETESDEVAEEFEETAEKYRGEQARAARAEHYAYEENPGTRARCPTPPELMLAAYS